MCNALDKFTTTQVENIIISFNNENHFIDYWYWVKVPDPKYVNVSNHRIILEAYYSICEHPHRTFYENIKHTTLLCNSFLDLEDYFILDSIWNLMYSSNLVMSQDILKTGNVKDYFGDFPIDNKKDLNVYSVYSETEEDTYNIINWNELTRDVTSYHIKLISNDLKTLIEIISWKL